MKLKDFRMRLENLVVRVVGKRIGWYYNSLTKGALRIIIEQELIASRKGLFIVELEEDIVFYKGKIPSGMKRRYVSIWKLIPERLVFGKHTIPAERRKVFGGSFKRCIRSSTSILFKEVYVCVTAIEFPCRKDQTTFSIDDIMLARKEPLKVQLKITHS